MTGEPALDGSFKPMNETTDATSMSEAASAFAPLWKRKWLILGVAVLVAVGSYFYYRHKPQSYSVSTQIFLGNGAEERAQIGSSSSASKKASGLNPTTQAALINSSATTEAVHEQLRRARKTRVVRAALKGKAKAKASEKSEFIAIEAIAGNAHAAALLANTTAQTYIKRENDRYRVHVTAAITLARRQLRRIEAGQLNTMITAASNSHASGSAPRGSSGASSTIQAATLSSKINELESELGVSQVTQVNAAKARSASLTSSAPKTNAIFGFAIGLLLAAFAAYALERLDRRLRSLAAIEESFRAPILAALRVVRRPLIVHGGRPVPAYVLREALWRLQTTLRVSRSAVNGRESENGHANGPRTILFVSPDVGDGRSTLVAALALTWAEAGEHVAVVEADFRRPVQSRLLRLGASHGLADVLTGSLDIEQALQSVAVAPQADLTGTTPGAAGSGATLIESGGSVSVLVGTTKTANPPALLARPATAEIVHSLAGEFDHVLIDAPSPLQVSDAMPLLDLVDGIVIVARVGHTRANSARRLGALLQQGPAAPVLGIVANAVPAADIKNYGIYTEGGNHRRGLRHALIGR
jgi:Mrp family chromosome partitioning ATPase/capsular polysaccharide biosynthesis protein